MTELVAYLLSIHDRLPNRAFIACLALAQLGPKPTERISTERLKEVLGVSHESYVSNLLKELRKHDLVDCTKGVPYHPGYRFFRVGPRSLQTKPTAIKP